jgi:hypothetical protein
MGQIIELVWIKTFPRIPKNIFSHVILHSIYSLAGQMDKACDQAEEIMRLNPKFSVDQIARWNLRFPLWVVAAI